MKNDESSRSSKSNVEDCHRRCTTGSTPSLPVTVVIHPTTGGQFELQVSKTDTIDHLKQIISRKLKVAKERLCLLHKERQLNDGTLLDNNILEGNKITLLPMVETGLLMQRPEQTVLQALENLNDSQVNDFLSGKAPLNLTMRLGDHMMFIQLQLSTMGTASAARKGLLPTPAGTSAGASSASSQQSNGNISPSTKNPSTPLQSEAAAVIPAKKSQEQPLDRTSISHVEAFSSTSRRLTDVTHLLDTRMLAEASHNLSQTLRQLSSQAMTMAANSLEKTEIQECQHQSHKPGAIIESMHHHGKGVYSGTFSGTLNPALQDRNGHPRKHISTIVHILNDLLGASPHYRRQSSRSIEALAMSLGRSRGIRGQGSAANKSEEEIRKLSQENLATKGKMEQLQMMMEERRCRRRARREVRSPYVWPNAGQKRDVSTPIFAVPIEASSDGACSTTTTAPSTPTSPTAPQSDSNQMDTDSNTETNLENGVDNSGSSTEYLNINTGTVMA